MKSRERIILSGTLASLVLAIAGCPGADVGTVGTKATKAPSDAPTTAASGVQTSPSGVNGSLATGAPTTAPAATPTPTPTPVPTPTPTPYVELASSLTFQVATATLSVAPAAGATPLTPFTHQVVYTYTLASGPASDSVTWASSNTAVATVNSAGLVTAGTAAGSTIITGTSILNKASGSPATASLTLTVTAQGGLNVIVQ